MTLRAQPEEFVSTKSMPWAEFSPGIGMKVLRLSPETGTWTLLLRAEAGASFARHRHLAAGEYFMLSGKMELRGGAQAGGVTALPGDYGWEPVSVIHDHVLPRADRVPVHQPRRRAVRGRAGQHHDGARLGGRAGARRQGSERPRSLTFRA